ncbi:MAG TPA: bacillithiol biosynthesis deacetylase BshB1 [Gemmatimonadaceae bacterium]|jgi:bacillithiol biosynthesis deacetylase BshB1|nr:bacillithiol biosynthesis deacetylase BshB1 [Gemmatimonadaceae bacterium]
MEKVDVLAVGAHPDDMELICGGTLIRAQMLGRSTGILDLAAGEMASRGSPELRAKEAAKAAKVMGVAVRENLGLPDGGIQNTPETRAKVAVVIRRLQPKIVITHSLHGRHPDHPIVAQLVRDACFVAGLKKVEANVPVHRPLKVIHALSFREDNQKPTFVVDISEAFEKKLEAIGCYESQFGDAVQAGEVYPNGEPLNDLIRHHAAHYGSLIRCRYGEPFYTTETMRVDDVGTLEVATF